VVVLIGYFNLGWVVVVVVVRVRRLVVVALSFLSDLVEVVSVVRLRFVDLVFGFDTSTLLVGSSDCCSSLLLARCPSRWATSPCLIENLP
jgi:hypothetical protein